MKCTTVGGIAIAESKNYKETIVDTALRQLGRQAFLSRPECSTDACFNNSAGGPSGLVNFNVRADCCLASTAITATGVCGKWSLRALSDHLQSSQ